MNLRCPPMPRPPPIITNCCSSRQICKCFLKEVETFATGDYAHALWEGNQISDAEKKTVAEKLHTYTGLPAAYWMKANLRVSGGNFEKNSAR